MTFEEILAEANEAGWYVYQAYQGGTSNNDMDCWGVTLRARVGGPRREIVHGSGMNLAFAIFEALAQRPELEPEITSSAEAPKLDLVAALGIKPTAVNIRRRA